MGVARGIFGGEGQGHGDSTPLQFEAPPCDQNFDILLLRKQYCAAVNRVIEFAMQ